MKSFQSTLILLVIVAVVGGYIWFNERGPIAEQGNTVLLRTDPARVQRVVLTHDEQTVTLQRSGDDWTAQEQAKGKEPSTPPVPADGDAVKTLLDQLQLLQSATVTAADAAKLKEFGLEKPKNRLTVDGTEVQFGTSPSFDATRVYARIGDQVALLPNALAEAVSKPFSDWRDKAALRVVADEVQSLRVQAPQVTATFEAGAKTGDEPREWKVTQPVAAPADFGAISGFLSQLSSTQATKFLDETPKDLKSWGLDKPQATIRADEALLKIGRKTEGGYAAQNSASPAVFEIPATLFDQANRPLKDWRQKQFVDFKETELSKLEVKARGGVKTLAKQDKKWRVSGGEASDAVHQAAFDLLLNLQALTAQEFIDQPQAPESYGFDKPALEVSYNDRSIQLGSKGGKVYARLARNGQYAPPVYELAPGTLENFKQSLDTLFEKK